MPLAAAATAATTVAAAAAAVATSVDVIEYHRLHLPSTFV
jgi:hypothetical protein